MSFRISMPNLQTNLSKNHSFLKAASCLFLIFLMSGQAWGRSFTTDFDAAVMNPGKAAIYAPDSIPILSTVVVNVSCYNGSDGSIDLTVSSGTPSFTYDWSDDGPEFPDNDNEDLSGLAAGIYTVTVTDANGFTATTSVIVTQAPAILLSTIVTQIDCNGGSNGAINLTATGGASPYTYDWSNDGPENPDNDPEDLSGLSAGTYTVTVTDANGCTTTTSATVTAPSALSLTQTVTNGTCGQANGAIDLTVTGGTSPYTYDWSNLPGSNNPQDLSGLAAGTYIVTVTDANNCTATTSATVVVTNGPTLSTLVTNVSCNSGSNGAIDLTVTGGTPSFTYNWGAGQPTTQDRTGLAAGTYCVTVTDASNCTATICATVTQPPATSLTTTITNVSCKGGSDGAIDLSVSSGVPPYTYNWGPGQPTTQDLTGLTAGTYCVTVTDANNCTATTCATVTQPQILLLTKTTTNVSCNGGSDGAIDLSVTGGISPYSYNWGPGQPTTQDRTGLTPGTYCVTVTDANNCTATTCATITQPTALSLTQTPTNLSCIGVANGAIDLTVAGGTPGYTYDWDNDGLETPDNDSQDLSGLNAGTYCVIVTDANGCTASICATILQPGPPAITCPGNQSRNTNVGVCTYTAVGTEFNATSFVGSNCPGASLTYVLSGATTGNGAATLAGKVFQKGQTTVQWTVTDAANVTVSCTFNVVVQDLQPPTITCPGPQTRNTNSNVCTYTAVGTEFNPTAFGDNCPGASIAYVLTGITTGSGTATLAGKIFQKGLTTVSWTVTDAASQSATCTFNVTVNDGQPLTIVCPGSQTRKTDPNICSYTTIGLEFDLVSISSDNCPGAPAITYALSGATTGTGTNTLANKVFQKGQTTVTWAASDAANNSTTCNFVVTVNDLQPPAITCPGSQTRNTNPNLCTYVALGTEFNPTAFGDNCPGVNIAYVLTGATSGSGTATLAGKVFQKGQTTVTWTATDAVNSTASCSFTLTVNDAQAPSLSCPGNQTRNANTGICTYTAVGTEFNPTTFGDNCPGVNIAYVLTGATSGSGTATLAGKVLNKGLTTVTWTATDAANNTASCSFTVDVKDAQAPSIICPFNQTRNTDLNLCSYAAVGAEFNPIAIGDNCSGTVGISYTLTGVTTGTGTTTLAGKVFNKGITTVKWTATDASSNTASCTFNVDVKDAQPPKFTSCPPVAVYNVNMTPGCTITIPNLLSYPNAAATDNCPGLTKTQLPAAGTVLTVVHNQSISVVITAKDAAGNTATCNRIVKAKDVTLPTITTCPPNRTVSLSPDCKITVPDMRAELVATDCSLPLTVTQNPVQGTVLPSDAGDVFNVIMTVTDAAGNAKTCTVVLTAEFRYFAYIPLNNNTLKVINTSSNTVVATVPGISTGPDGACVYDKWVYVAADPDKVRVIDGTTNTLAATITVGNYPFGICVSPDGSRVYVTNIGSNTVSVINTTTNAVIATIGLGNNAYPLGICVSPDGSRVYAVRNNYNNVAVINTATNAVIANVGVGSFPKGICVSPNGTRVYVANHTSTNISVINTSTNAVLTIPVGLYCNNVCITPNGNYLYVTTQQGSVVVINTTTLVVVANVPVLGGNGAGISVTPDGNYVYVQCFYCNDISVISTATNTVVATIPTGASHEVFGNFIGGPLCLFGNNQPPPSGPDEATPAGEEPVSSERALFPAGFRAMPNPFTDELSIAFDLQTPARAQVVLTDVTGRLVFFEKDKRLDAGPQSFVWNTEDLPEGAYLVGLKVDGKAWTYRKVMLIR